MSAHLAPVDPRYTQAFAAAASVCDPEVPVLTIADLGVLRDVRLVDDGVEVVITPTYSGCPAMDMITVEVDLALEKAGFSARKVILSLTPAWTSDWMSVAGKEKLRSYGIAPPAGKAGGRGVLFGVDLVACPRCGSEQTERLSEFGSTACKAQWRCTSCKEPFDYFKCI